MKLIDKIKLKIKPKSGTLVQIVIMKKGVKAHFDQKVVNLSKPHKEYIKRFLEEVVKQIE